MDVKEQKNASVELMETAPAVYLTTNGPGGYPYTRAMLNLRNREQYPGQVPLFAGHSEDLLVYFSTNTSSQKLRQIHGLLTGDQGQDHFVILLVGGSSKPVELAFPNERTHYSAELAQKLTSIVGAGAVQLEERTR